MSDRSGGARVATVDLPDDLEVDIPDQRPPPRVTTLGTALTALDERDIDQALVDAGLWTPGRLPDVGDRYHRDVAIAEASGRWLTEPRLEPRHRDYVPGDVCGLRAAAFASALMIHDRRLSEFRAGESLSSDDRWRMERDLALGAWLLDAPPYFLPVSSALGITGSYPPDPELLDELRLPFPRVAVYFGADLAIPAALLGADDALLAITARTDDAYRRGVRRFGADELPPFTTRSTELALARHREVKLCGVAFHADDQGRLGDLALWLTVVPSDDTHPRRFTPAMLAWSRARPLALNLAAAVAWGDWEPPPADLDLPANSASPGFRRQLRRGQFRRREPTGAAVGVRVLDARRMNRSSADGTGTHASPFTHLRRGHWRRQRVGPRSDWRYERRYIPPVVVNPGATSQEVTIYRLPTPPD